MDRRTLPTNGRYWRETRAIRGYAAKEESCIRKAATERGVVAGQVGLADTSSLNEAASRWADCALSMEIEWPDRIPLGLTESLSSRTHRSSSGCFDVAPLLIRVATKGIPTPPPEGDRFWLGLGHQLNTNRGVTSSFSVMNCRRSSRVRVRPRSPVSWPSAGVPRSRSSGPRHTGNRRGSASPSILAPPAGSAR